MRFGKGSTHVVFDPGTLDFQVFCHGQCFRSDTSRAPYFLTKDRQKVMFADARRVEHREFRTGVGEGLRSRFSDFARDGEVYDVGFETYMWVEEETGHVRFEFLPLQEKKFDLSCVAWPAPLEMKPSAEGYAVLPVMQGVLLPDVTPQEIKPFMSRRMFGRESSMPWWGQVSDGKGYMAIVETPWDAEMDYHHTQGSGTSIGINWVGSLGRIQYRRQLTLRFFGECNYVTLCKEYSDCLKATGSIVTIEEKILKNAKVGDLIGAPVIHTPFAHWHCEPESAYYSTTNNEENDKVHSFGDIARDIESIKELGVEKAYVHIDGWGKGGYDNLHPDVLPPSEPAGGIAGMRDMLARIRALGYTPALHDQYRDYYLNAETYSDNQAVLLANGVLDACAIWPGGKQTMLCAQLAPDYVRRNYTRLERLGLVPDGAYLDVFSVVELDECDNELHRMTRKECMEKRCESFEIIRSKGLIVSSEEPIDQFVAHLDLVHHGPYAYAIWENNKQGAFGIPIPLFNLVYHDCILLPWSMGKGCWGLPAGEDGMLHALLNGGMPYLSTKPDKAEVDRVAIVTGLHAVVAKSEMLSHSFVGSTKSRQQTEFAGGTTVMVDFESGDYAITWPDKSTLEGNVGP